MIKGLLALDENLASSIALRYASRMIEQQQILLQVGHVEPLDNKAHSAGSGWIRKTWERGLEEAGHRSIQRLLNTEKVPCPFIGPPKVFVGDRDASFLNELEYGQYDLFMEGNLNTSNTVDFQRLLSSPLYSKTPCPILMVKNIVQGNHVAVLCGAGIDHESVLPKALQLIKGDDFLIDLLFFRHHQSSSPDTLTEKETAILKESEQIIASRNRRINLSHIICGPPESQAELLKKYRTIVSPFPQRKSLLMKLLAHCPSPVLLIH